MAVMDPVMLEEWIGKHVRVIDASNPAQVGLEGIIVDEKARTIQIRKADGKEVCVQKSGTRMQTSVDHRIAIIEAGEALMRSEDRTKRLYRKCMKK